MTLQNMRQNEPSTTLQSTQHFWYFRGISPSTPANQTRQHSPDIRPKHRLPRGAVSACSPDKTDWISMEISWERKFPDQPLLSTLPTFTEVRPYHTYWCSRDLEIIKSQHVKQIHILLGKKKSVRKLFPPHLIFLTEELIAENLLHPQKLNIHSWHPTIPSLFSFLSLRYQKVTVPLLQPPGDCFMPGCTNDAEMWSHAQRFIRLLWGRAKAAFGEKL